MELSREEIEALTIPQLKQQLRLRSLKVSGRKQDLVERLLDFSRAVSVDQSSMKDLFDDEPAVDENGIMDAEILSDDNAVSPKKKSKSRKFAEERGKELIDVEEFLEEDDKGKSVKSSTDKSENIVGNDEINPVSSNPETWGDEARIVDDFEGRSPVVDALSRTVVEYGGSNKTMVQAYVVASRDAMKPFLSGVQAQNQTEAEERLREIQTRREKAAKRPVRFDNEGVDSGDEVGIYDNIIERDFSDWGKYTLTGAQLSAQEVQGVLFLSDVYGAFSEDTKALADKIAFECQPVVVMVPDLFRGDPWNEVKETPGLDAKGRTYEQWRAAHSDVRVNVDIRAAAAVLRQQYGVSSVTVWGTCYGGGRALEVAAGYLPEGKVLDIDGSVGPKLVRPEVAIAWYPTRYVATDLFGINPQGANGPKDEKNSMAIMAVFAGNDLLPGATPGDAETLKAQLESDPRVKDLMVKVFPDQEHGFAHLGLSQQGLQMDDSFERFIDDEFGGAGRISMDSGDAEVACLLSTAFMETYSRVFLPTTGVSIREDSEASDWSNDIQMKDLSELNKRDIRSEIEDALDNFQDQDLGGINIDPNDESQREEFTRILRGMAPANMPPDLQIQDDDTLEVILAKIRSADPSFQLF